MLERFEDVRTLARYLNRGAVSVAQVYPTLAAPASVTTGASKTFGAWVEVIAAHSGAGALVAFWYYPAFTSGGWDSKVQFGVGAAGSEAVIGEASYMDVDTGGNQVTPIYFPHPMRIAPNARVALRASTSQAANQPQLYYIIVAPRPFK